MEYDVLKTMYDKFIDSSELTTQDLLGCGLNKNNLTKLVEDGTIVRIKRGIYSLDKVDGLLYHCKRLLTGEGKDRERANLGLERCLEIDPENGSVHTRMFFNKLNDGKFDDVVTHMDYMGRDKFYRYDWNLWLYLLSFITELPEEYKSIVSKLNSGDVRVVEGDTRYPERTGHNKYRCMLLEKKFDAAESFYRSFGEKRPKKFYELVTLKLAKEAKKRYKQVNTTIYQMIDDGEFENAYDFLVSENELHGLSMEHRQLLFVLDDMFKFMDSKTLPVYRKNHDYDDFLGVLEDKNYVRAFKLGSGLLTTKTQNVGALVKVLKKFEEEYNAVKKPVSKEVPVVDVQPKIEEVDAVQKVLDAPRKKKFDTVSNQMFVDITTYLNSGDIQNARESIGRYLDYTDKGIYIDYVDDLVKLSVLEGDKSFDEVMYTLAEISKDQFEYFGAAYIQDFYFSLSRKDYKKAAVYLDILSMSQTLGGVKLNTSDMKTRLLEDATIAGLTEADLDLGKRIVITHEDKLALMPEDKVLKVEEVMSTVGTTTEEVKEEVGATVEETKPEESQVTYTLADIVDEVLDNTNLIMLAPMSEEDAQRVVLTTQRFPEIQARVFETEDRKRQVFLRYREFNGDRIDLKATIQAADEKFNNWEYNDAIDLYQLALTKLNAPNGYLFARLGLAYEKTTYDGDYSKALDYMSMAYYLTTGDEEKWRDRRLSDLNRIKNKAKNYSGVGFQFTKK